MPEPTVETTASVGPPDSSDPPAAGPSTVAPPQGTDDSAPGDDTGSEQRSAAFTVGDASGEVSPLAVEIRNERSSARTVEVVVEDTRRGAVRVGRQYTLPPGGEVSGEIRAPSDYEIRVTLPDRDREAVETVARSLFDTCNDYGTTVRIESEDISARTWSTLVLCRTATPRTD